MLQVIWFREGGFSEVHDPRLRVSLAPDQTRLIRRLPGPRRADGHYARGCRRHGLRSALGRRKPTLPPAIDLGAFGRRRDHEAAAYHHCAEQD